MQLPEHHAGLGCARLEQHLLGWEKMELGWKMIFRESSERGIGHERAPVGRAGAGWDSRDKGLEVPFPGIWDLEVPFSGFGVS